MFVFVRVRVFEEKRMYWVHGETSISVIVHVLGWQIWFVGQSIWYYIFDAFILISDRISFSYISKISLFTKLLFKFFRY